MISKRIFDLILVAMLAVPSVFVVAALYVVAISTHGRPFLYTGTRMNGPDSDFRLVKLRTMRPGDPTQRVLGGDSLDQVTGFGRWLRRTRLDELPQLWNVLRGEMSLVGPRPPLKKHVSAAPESYARILGLRPGITGLATVMVCTREERLLTRCATSQETEAVYRRRCLPIKLRLDRIYADRHGVGLDLYVLYLTLARFVRLPGRRARRLWAETTASRARATAPEPRQAVTRPIPSFTGFGGGHPSRRARLK